MEANSVFPRFILYFILFLPGLFRFEDAKGQIRYVITNKAVNRFIPQHFFGAALDGHEQGDIERIYKPANVADMLSAGLKPVSYRLRTELGNEAWHWNPAGHWSDEKNQQGYWVSDSNAINPIRVSYGYRLPRRGNTHDQANDDGYSRIDDADTNTFWKSNPYLDTPYLSNPDQPHAQWVIIDLGRNRPVNALRIRWALPFARNGEVSYAGDIGQDYFDPLENDLWHPFESGKFEVTDPCLRIFKLSTVPVKVRFIRILLSNSSHTGFSNSTDLRDKCGFAVREMEAGLLSEKNVLTDYIIHQPGKSQTTVYVSSTDPWHRATDLDPHTEQPGVDLFFQSGIHAGLPAMMPAAVLYDNPENMLSLFRYLDKKNYPVQLIEMGEEPEGQRVNPDDYAALYILYAETLRKLSAVYQFGGPGFSALATTDDDAFSYTERQWTRQFLKYLADRNKIRLFNFFSFEWYPFDDICGPAPAQLQSAPGLLQAALKGYPELLPPGTPMIITEYGYSAYSGKHECDIEGALLDADIAGMFLTLGGSQSFLYGYEPGYPDQTNNCSWGNNMFSSMDDTGKIIYHTAPYYSTRLLMEQWAAPDTQSVSIMKAEPESGKKKGKISVYPLQFADSSWSVLLINKDPVHTASVTLSLKNTGGTESYPLQLQGDYYTYDASLFHWVDKGPDSYPSRSLLPEKRKAPAGTPLLLKPYSITIVHGKL